MTPSGPPTRTGREGLNIDPISQRVPDLSTPSARRVAVHGWQQEGAPHPAEAVPSSPPSHEAAGIYPPTGGVHHQSGYHPGLVSPASQV